MKADAVAFGKPRRDQVRVVPTIPRPRNGVERRFVLEERCRFERLHVVHPMSRWRHDREAHFSPGLAVSAVWAGRDIQCRQRAEKHDAFMPLKLTAAQPYFPAERRARNDLQRARPAHRSKARHAGASATRTWNRCLNSRRPGSSSTSAGVFMIRDSSCDLPMRLGRGKSSPRAPYDRGSLGVGSQEREEQPNGSLRARKPHHVEHQDGFAPAPCSIDRQRKTKPASRRASRSPHGPQYAQPAFGARRPMPHGDRQRLREPARAGPHAQQPRPNALYARQAAPS